MYNAGWTWTGFFGRASMAPPALKSDSPLSFFFFLADRPNGDFFWNGNQYSKRGREGGEGERGGRERGGRERGREGRAGGRGSGGPGRAEVSIASI